MNLEKLAPRRVIILDYIELDENQTSDVMNNSKLNEFKSLEGQDMHTGEKIVPIKMDLQAAEKAKQRSDGKEAVVLKNHGLDRQREQITKDGKKEIGGVVRGYVAGVAFLKLIPPSVLWGN
ncbi:hypothetical protein Tco_0920246 [Tanacetum coccineum]